MIINHNMSAMNGARNSKVVEGDLRTSMNKLASGMRITKAGDDASGLAVSEKMRAQIRGLRQASRNAADGVSMIQTTEGYLQATTDLIHRIRELAVQASNGIYTDEDLTYIQVEVSALVAEVDRVASHAQFNGMNLLTGRFAVENGGNQVTASMWLHIGANMDQRTRVHIGTMTSTALGLKEPGSDRIIDTLTNEHANNVIGVMDNALQIVNKQRADLGAYQNRLEMAIKSLDIGAENIQASESRIRDLNMAEETVKLTTSQILSQTAVAMLAQANSSTQHVLRLLQ